MASDDHTAGIGLSDSMWQEVIERIHENFIDYVVSEAKTELVVESFVVDAVREACRELKHNGYNLPADTGAKLVAGRKAFRELTRDMRSKDRVGKSPKRPLEREIQIDNVLCYCDPTLSGGTGILIHPEAVTIPPSNYGNTRPWVVRHGNGVVVVRISDNNNHREVSDDGE